MDVHDRGNIRWDGQTIVVNLTRTELEYWEDFFPKYCRDGYGDVGHLDVELVSISIAEEHVNLALVVRLAPLLEAPTRMVDERLTGRLFKEVKTSRTVH